MKMTQISKEYRRALVALAVAALAILLLAGCEPFADPGPPANELPAAAVFENAASADAAMGEAFARMRDGGMLSGSPSGASALLGLYADELDFYGSQGLGAYGFYANGVPPVDAELKAWWDRGYAQVYAANAVLEGVAGSQALPASDRDRLSGEARFARALAHLSLWGAFGAVPYVQGTDYRANSTVPRTAPEQVLALAVADLEQAVALLPEAYASPDRTRPNRHAARALLARVLLYAGEWEAASDAASAVIGEQALYVMEAPEDEFAIASGSVLWQLSPRQAGFNALEGGTFPFTVAPPPSLALAPGLVASFEPGDARRVAWVREVSGYFHADKYRSLPPGASEQYSVVLRLAEMYLVRAEARIGWGFFSGAREDIDAVRARAGLPPTQAESAPELLEAVLAERRAEFFTEFGHRFLDLKRLGRADAVLGATKLGWEETDRLLPVPQSELLLNPALLPQNPGY